jgi:5-methylcytosine-specific restriction endonuclease McrA
VSSPSSLFKKGRDEKDISMKNKPFRIHKRPQKIDSQKSVDEIVRELKKVSATKGSDYRERSLKIHGLICAKCGREFDEKTRHLLTVHHKDGNHLNNPQDGSNWENLCIYCHDDEHSRELLSSYFKDE